MSQPVRTLRPASGDAPPSGQGGMTRSDGQTGPNRPIPDVCPKCHDGAVVDVSSNPLVVDIARRLVADGRFVTELHTDHLQTVVDVGWAARQAGQLLGRPVTVATSRRDEPGAGLVVVAEFAHERN